MRYGEGFGCYWSNPETFIIVLGITDLKSGVAVKFIVIANYSQYFQMVVDGRNVGVPVFVNGGVTTTMTGSYQSNVVKHTFSIEGMGPWSNNSVFDVTSGQILFASSRADKLHLEITANPFQFSVDGKAS